MKIEVELVINSDRKFLNYWDYIHGDDVCCQIVDNKLILMGDEKREITLEEFMDMVERTVRCT